MTLQHNPRGLRYIQAASAILLMSGLGACASASFNEEPAFTATCIATSDVGPDGTQYTRTVYGDGATIRQARNHLQFQGADTDAHPCTTLTITPINTTNDVPKPPYQISAPSSVDAHQYILRYTRAGAPRYEHRTLQDVVIAYQNDPSLDIRVYSSPAILGDERSTHAANTRTNHIYDSLRSMGIPAERIRVLSIQDLDTSNTEQNISTITTIHHPR